MSRITVAALALALTALGFGLGYQAGIPREPPEAAPARAPTGVAPRSSEGISTSVRQALANPDRMERAAEIARLLQRLGPESIGEVTAAYDAAFIEVGDVTIVLLADWWGRLEPARAFEWTRSERIGRSPQVMAAVVRSWAERNPQEAARAVEGIENPERRRNCVDAVVRSWNDSGKPGLVDYLVGLPPGIDRQRAISVVARRKVHQDGVDETFRWAEALPDDPDRFKLNVFRRVGSWAAEVDPQRAAAWAERHGEDEYGQGLFRRVGTRWAQQDGAAAMTWLGTLPAGQERDVGVQETYRVWLSRDNEAATNWMRDTELEPWLDPAFAMYVTSLGGQDPEQALEWTSLIRDPERRREATIKIARHWHQVDPDAARAWLEQSDLPEQDRKWVLQPRRGPRGRRAAPRQGDVPVPQEENG